MRNDFPLRFYVETVIIALFTVEFLMRAFAHSISLKELARFFICKSRCLCPMASCM